MPTGTIVSATDGQIILKVELDGAEHQLTFTTTVKVDEWVKSHPKWFAPGCVVEYASNKSGVIGKITQAGNFQKASEPPKKSIQEQWEEKQKAAGQTQVTQAPKIKDMVHPPPSAEEIRQKAEKAGFRQQTEIPGVAQREVVHEVPKVSDNRLAEKETLVIGSFDPAKIHGYEITDTCQVVQYEPITIKVVGDDPDTCRRALIEAWGLFGQNTEVTRETVQKHINTHLVRRL